MRFTHFWLLSALVLALTSTVLASTTWYVNGVNGSDGNDCLSPTTACKTIGHAISRAGSGDSIKVAAATYAENLTIGISLNVIGSSANTTIIDGGGLKTNVVSIPKSGTLVTLSRLTMRNGFYSGIYNGGALTINNSTISGNTANITGGGIYNGGALTINNSTISGNRAGTPKLSGNGGGISNGGKLTINNSTISANITTAGQFGTPSGGGISNGGTLTINNSTISANSAKLGGGIDGTATLQNSIVANSTSGGNCSGTITSDGYNLSSDTSCNFNNVGDLNNTDPKLGPLQNNGGPTQTQALLSGSPAIDAGNPSGCTDGNGHLLKTDQRGAPRPDKEDTSGCDMGAYESQTD